MHDILEVPDVEADMRIEHGWNISQVLVSKCFLLVPEMLTVYDKIQ